MKMNRPAAEILEEISDLNMARFYSGEFQMWLGGEVKFLTNDGNYMGVARFANKSGFVNAGRNHVGAPPSLSPKGKNVLGMTSTQNSGRWGMLVDTLKELGL